MAKVAVTRILYVDRLQILANPHSLFWNTRFISDILKARMKEKKSYTISLNCPQYVWKEPSSARQMPKPDRTLKDFLNFPTLEEGRTLMFFSEFYINRTTLPCLSSLGRMYYICSPYHRRRNSIKLRL